MREKETGENRDSVNSSAIRSKQKECKLWKEENRVETYEK